MKQEIKQSIQKVLAKLYPDHQDIDFTVEFASPDVESVYASNIAMVFAEEFDKKPSELADIFVSELRLDGFKIESAGPGFLNFTPRDEFLVYRAGEILDLGEKHGSSDIGKDRLAIVEYFQLNVAKPPHVGHLRSAVIGDALKRILSFVGYQTVSDTHVGDWGTQFGMLIAAYKEKIDTDSELAVKMLEDVRAATDVYVEYSYAAETQTEGEMREIAKQEFVKLENGDEENTKIWKKFVETSKKEFVKSAELLRLNPFEYDLGESFYQDQMPKILEHLEKKDLLMTGETGERYVDLEKYKLGRLICVKSDGGTTYELRDLATVAYRYDEIAKGQELAWNLYVVDSRQAHDFRQVFKTTELLGYDMSKSIHVAFGFISLPEGAISTRKGRTVSLENLLTEAKKRALKIIEEKNPELDNKQEVAEQIALGAVKYFDLSHNRKSDIVFDWNEALNLEGNSGPYIQYTHARLRSILRKSKVSTKVEVPPQLEKVERDILKKLYIFPDVIQNTADDFMPSHLATYLYGLSSLLNRFYQELPVLKEKDGTLMTFRLYLVSASAQVLKNGLSLLGIKAPEEM